MITIYLALGFILLAAIIWRLRPVGGSNADNDGSHTLGIKPRPSAILPSAPLADTAMNDTIQRLVREGELIGAVKLVKESRGLSLAEARDAVEAMRSGAGEASALPTRLTPDQAAAHPEFQRLMRMGQALQAVKFYRDATAYGLQEAKEAFDRAVAKM